MDPSTKRPLNSRHQQLRVRAWSSLPGRAGNRLLVKPREIAALPRQFECFEPKMPDSQRAKLYDGWQDAVARAKSMRVDG
jgi:hypothetical protein